MTTRRYTIDENEQGALTRRLIERSGLSRTEAQDVVDAYMHAESLGEVASPLPDPKPIAHRGN